MLEPPFDILQCSWPRPVRHAGGRWRSAPEWDAPPMPFWPQPRWTTIDDELCWTIDWRELFRASVPGRWAGSGRLRGYHLVFWLRVNGGGELAVWTDHGCLIRRNGQIVHNDRGVHPLTRHTIDVDAGDLLEVAQWHQDGDWLWGACLSQPGPPAEPPDVLLPYRDAVLRRLSRPEGPPLKMFTGGSSPARTVIALYSMVLNGYTPSEVLLFGEHQWGKEARELFVKMLPFARVVPTPVVCDRLVALGGQPLVDLAESYWYVMKACVCLLFPPTEFCAMDDDIVILDRVDDALGAFRRHDLVFAADPDWGDAYLDAWGPTFGRTPAKTLPTGTFNAGLYWMRNGHKPRRVAQYALNGPHPTEHREFVWEQGLIAVLCANDRTRPLPERYLYPLYDGMPGGFLEYDYARNPCGFASVHYGAVDPKPEDRAMLVLAPEVLGRICPPDRAPA